MTALCQLRQYLIMEEGRENDQSYIQVSSFLTKLAREQHVHALTGPKNLNFGRAWHM